MLCFVVVLDTTKVQIFKQITTIFFISYTLQALFQIPQRYRFSSKSQRMQDYLKWYRSCFRYHKGTDFQANHNQMKTAKITPKVVLDTTKVQIFKQITTAKAIKQINYTLFQIPQRYRFSSKSQPYASEHRISECCFRYHKGTDFQANHNKKGSDGNYTIVVLDTTKVQIFKQITTH